jgi:hypothetical protein
MRTTVVGITALLACTSLCAGDIIDTVEIGEGFYTSTVQIDFSNGNGYLFDVHWEETGTTGWDLLLAIAEESDDVALDYSVSEWGVFLQGIVAFDDSDWGVGTGWPEVEDYWHYWQRESSSQPWEFSSIGADVRQVSDGSWDGWVFLSAGEPQPVPAPGVLVLLGIGGLFRNRRTRHSS